ncbi:MAG TPA: hypothetical protein DDW65_07420 [Firmicutes bacterium]|nr:hypothetical protein [Bacillota bacterium]
MNKFLAILLATILALTIAGCGGGKGSTGSLSSDYYGLETGFELITTAEEKDSIAVTTISGTITTLVTGETASGSGIYKVARGIDSTSETIKLGTEGDYIQKSGTDYNNYGYWEEGEDTKVNSGLILKNPVTSTSTSEYWEMNVTGQETVTVPAGTFTAWVFESSEDHTDYEDKGYGPGTDVEKKWFVAQLGVVKESGTYTRTGDSKTVTFLSQLTSYKKGVTLNANSLTSAQTATEAGTDSKILRRFRH